MKQRTNGFLAGEKIDQSGEIFDYIVELHLILWDFCRYFRPGCGGSLEAWIDQIMPEVRSAALTDNPSLREIKDKLDALKQDISEIAQSIGENYRGPEILKMFETLAESQGKLLARLDALDAGLHETAMRNHQQVRGEISELAGIMLDHFGLRRLAVTSKARKKARR